MSANREDNNSPKPDRDRQVNDAEFDAANAEFKARTARGESTWADLLRVIRSLGYGRAA